MNLLNSKDCINCEKASIYGSMDKPNVSCTSSDYVHQNCFKQEGRFCAYRCSGFKQGGTARAGMIQQYLALKFILAGKCEFILHSTKTGDDFKYELVKKESKDNKDKFIYFLSILHGSEKTYAGVVWFDDKIQEFKFSTGKSGKIQPTELNIRSLLFVLNKLVREQEVQYLIIYHVGKCGKCGKKLTTPESILTGLGPTCSNKIGIPRVKINKQGEIIS